LTPGAEQLPLADASVDVAMAIYTDFHWRDRRRGIAEMMRVSRRGVVLLTVDRAASARYWLTRDYFPGASSLFAGLEQVTDLLSWTWTHLTLGIDWSSGATDDP
jgi:ubiquinone/menaquinone biosynthesis C-methylase UbiE